MPSPRAVRETIVLLCVVLIAALCFAQEGSATTKNQSKTRQVTAAPAKACCRVVLTNKSMATGEPVPGAEILIEQEPGATAMRLTTDSNGAVTFKPRKPGAVKFTVNLGAAQVKQLKTITPKAEKSVLVLQVIDGSKTTEHSMEVNLANASASGGPYTTSVSNMEQY